MNNIKSSLIGNNGRCFDLRHSFDSSHLLSASEDGTAKLWNLNTNKLVHTFNHNPESEVLRSAFISNETVCTGGSDGNVIIWKLNDSNSTSNSTYSKIFSIPHNDQIYACTTIGCVSSPHVITASDNLLHLWDLSVDQNNSYSISFEPINIPLDVGEGAEVDPSQSSSFGGPRNPDNKAFIFDVQPAYTSNPASSTAATAADQSYEGNPFATTLALALSDGTVRLVDLRNPSEAHTFPVTHGIGQTHITGVTWSPDKFTIVSSTGSGDLILFDLRMSGIRCHIQSAHSSSCFGSSFYSNTNQSRCVSWSSDGSLRVWDTQTLQGDCSRTDCLKEIILPDYPIFCALPNLTNNKEELIVGGGSSKKSFMGPLIHTVKLSDTTE